MIDRKKGLQSLAKSIKDGSMYMLSDTPPIDVVPTGIATLDSALGIGGLARGGIYVVWGPPDAGKSALAYSAVGNYMKSNKEAMACIIDVERAARPEWLEKFGIDPERVVVIREETIEDYVNKYQQIMRAGIFDFVIIDSLGAVIRATDFDGKDGNGGDANKQMVGGASSVITRWMNKANAELTSMDKIENTGSEVIRPVIIFINQVRDKLNSMYGGHDMPGGNNLKHMNNVIIRVVSSGAPSDRMFGTVNGEKVLVGNRVNCTVERNKFAPKGRSAGYNFVFAECPEYEFGIDSRAACFDLAVKYGVIEARGAWCYFGTEGEPGFVKANGKAAMTELLRDNDEFYDAVYRRTMDEIAMENEEVMARVAKASELE